MLKTAAKSGASHISETRLPEAHMRAQIWLRPVSVSTGGTNDTSLIGILHNCRTFRWMPHFGARQTQVLKTRVFWDDGRVSIVLGALRWCFDSETMTGLGRAGLGWAGPVHFASKPFRTVPNRPEPFRSEPFRTVPNRSEPSRTVPSQPSRTVPNRPEPFQTPEPFRNRSEPFRTVPNRPEPFRTVPNQTKPNRPQMMAPPCPHPPPSPHPPHPPS